jgi:hypothetical protein
MICVAMLSLKVPIKVLAHCAHTVAFRSTTNRDISTIPGKNIENNAVFVKKTSNYSCTSAQTSTRT